MKKLLASSLLFFSVSAFSAPVNLTGFGIGGMLGDPTGFSFKGHLGHDHYFDVALAYGTSPADGFYIHGDYLIEKPERFQIENEVFNLYYGIGARTYAADSKKHKDEVHLGVRVPVGINYYFKDPAVEVFGEISAIMEVAPETEADVDFSIGARYWF